MQSRCLVHVTASSPRRTHPPPALIRPVASLGTDKGGSQTLCGLFRESTQRSFSPPLFFAQRSGAKNKGGAGGGFPAERSEGADKGGRGVGSPAEVHTNVSGRVVPHPCAYITTVPPVCQFHCTAPSAQTTRQEPHSKQLPVETLIFAARSSQV